MGFAVFTLIRNLPEINADKIIESARTKEKGRTIPLAHCVEGTPSEAEPVQGHPWVSEALTRSAFLSLSRGVCQRSQIENPGRLCTYTWGYCLPASQSWPRTCSGPVITSSARQGFSVEAA